MSLNYLNCSPKQIGRIKVEYTDFIVKEVLGYPLSGSGEFVVVQIRKTNANTLFVGEKLAQFAGISAKQMSYAGLKDRHAITEQYFCLHLPGKATPDFTQFHLEGVEILSVVRHQKKIRIGSLKGNNFTILLRDVEQTDDMLMRLHKIQLLGFPNYFTEQRFGRDNYNFIQAQRWAKGEIQIKDRHKRKFYLSAARSEIFNLIVSQRMQHQLQHQVLAGDIVQLAGSHSWFYAQPEALIELNERLEKGDILLTAPLIGEDSLEQSPIETEANIISENAHFVELMKKERVKSMRRAMFGYPQQFQWQFNPHGLLLSFFLGAGSYATALVRELIQIAEKDENQSDKSD